MKKKTLLMTVAILTIVFSSVAQEKGTFTDSRDGKVYKTVKIGAQIWMAENLAYKGGSIILPSVAYDNLESNVGIYGYLYDWETAKFVAPSGWHLPSDIEWKTLINFLGGDSLAGGKLKESGSTHWYNNTNATNESGFAGLPGGFCMPNGKFNFSNVAGFWWSSTEKTSTDAWFCNFAFNSSKITSGPINKSFKFAVRCIKDNSTSKSTTQTETKASKSYNTICDAINSGDVEAIKNFINSGIDLNKQYKYEYKTNWMVDSYPVQMLFKSKNKIICDSISDLFKLFVDHGFDLKTIPNADPIIYSIVDKYTEENVLKMLQLLVDKNYDINVADFYGSNVMNKVSGIFDCSRSYNIAKFLIDHGGDPTAKNLYKKSSIAIAKDRDCTEVVNLFKSYKKNKKK